MEPLDQPTSGIPVLYLVACVRNIIICNDS